MARTANLVGLLAERILLEQAKVGCCIRHNLLAAFTEESLSICDLVVSSVPLVMDDLLNDVASRLPTSRGLCVEAKLLLLSSRQLVLTMHVYDCSS